MDNCTHEVRTQYWKDIIHACQQRPAGMSAKSWLKDNEILEQSYYKWQRKFRQEAYEQLNYSSKEIPSICNHEVTFTEIPAHTLHTNNSTADFCNDYKPAAIIKSKALSIAISNEISDHLLSRIIQEVSNA